jgi:catechol 2,3-dioxygenase-like lactoylglutathione lyase family enzyme
METKLGHINVVADDISAMADFFVRNFGFTAGKLTRLSGPWVSILTRLPDAETEFIPLASKTSSVRIEVLKYIRPASLPESPRTGIPNLGGYRHIGFEVDDVDAKTADLKDQGYEFLSEPQTVSEMKIRVVYFFGPEGILVELAQHM